MFQVLTKMIGAEKLLGLVAFTKFVSVGQVGDAIGPIRLRFVGEFFPAVAADVCGSDGVCGRRWLAVVLRCHGCSGMEGALVVAR